LEADPCYRWIAYLLVPILWLSFVFAAWFVMRHGLPLHGLLAMVLIAGSAGGFCINIGHEMGHKNTALERWLAGSRFGAHPVTGTSPSNTTAATTANVATPADPASSRDRGIHLPVLVARDARCGAARLALGVRAAAPRRTARLRLRTMKFCNPRA